MSAKAYDTNKSSVDLEAYIKTIPDGHVIVAACKDDCLYRLSQDVKAWFARMGSKEIWNLEYR